MLHLVRLLPWTLAAVICAVPSALSSTSEGGPPAPALLTIAEVQKLPLKEGREVQFEGVVTVSGHGFTYVQDNDDAIFVQLVPGAQLAPASRVRIFGKAVPGRFLPFVIDAKAEILGDEALPQPERLEISELPIRKLDCRYVELEGIVRGIAFEPSSDGLEWQIDLQTGGGRRRIALPLPSNHPKPEEWIDARVRVRGGLGSYLPPSAQLSSFRVASTSMDDVKVIEPAPADPFSMPLQSAASVLTGGLAVRPEHRQHVDGLVIHVRHGKGVWLCSHGVCFFPGSTETPDVVPGDLVETVGFVEPGEFSPMLAGAIFKKMGRKMKALEPFAPTLPEVLDGKLDQWLLRFDALLLGKSDTGRIPTLSVKYRGMVFDAELPLDYPLAKLETGSLLRLAGICSIVPRPDNRNAVAGIRLLVRTPEDLQVLSPPKRSPVKALLWCVGIMLAGAIFATMRANALGQQNAVLDRRVRERAEALEIAHEKLKTEAERNAVLTERNRIANEIHDTLEQGFTGVMLQIDSALPRLSTDPATARRYLETARQMMSYSRDDARQAIWNLHANSLADADLPTALTEFAARVSPGPDPHVSVEIVGPQRRLPGEAEHHILRVAQESVTNALKHGRASEIHVRLEYLESYVRLSVTDNGVGFDDEAPPVVGGARFGLSGMRERANKLRAGLVIQSKAGRGTSIGLTVPSNGISA